MAKFILIAREAGDIALNLVALGLLLSCVATLGALVGAWKVGAVYSFF